MSIKKILETRTIGSTDKIPTEIFDRVLIRLKDESPFFRNSNLMITDNTDKIVILSDVDQVDFEKVELDLKDLRESMKVTSELYQNSDEIETYLEEKIFTKILDAMETAFAKELANAPGTPVKVTDTLGLPMLLKIKRTMKTSYLTRACWIVDRPTYDKLAEMVINDKPLVKSDMNDKTGIISLEMLGHPLYVVEAITADVKIAFINLNRGFAVRLLNDLSVRKLSEIGYTDGAQVFALNTMFCGKVIETAAMVQGNYSDAPVGTSMNYEKKVEKPKEEEKVEEKVEQKEEPVTETEKVEKPATKKRGRKKKEDK